MEKDIDVWVNTAISTINLISLIVIFRSVKKLIEEKDQYYANWRDAEDECALLKRKITIQKNKLEKMKGSLHGKN